MKGFVSDDMGAGQVLLPFGNALTDFEGIVFDDPFIILGWISPRNSSQIFYINREVGHLRGSPAFQRCQGVDERNMY